MIESVTLLKSPWDWLAFGLVALSAALQAINGAKIPLAAGAPAILTASVWQFVPMMMVVVASLLVIISVLLSRRLALKETQSKSGINELSPPLEMIRNKVFENERVVLDGKSITNCSLSHVTIVYNGGRAEFSHNKLGLLSFESENPLVNTAWRMMFELGFLKIPLFENKQTQLTPKGFTGPHPLGPPVPPSGPTA